MTPVATAPDGSTVYELALQGGGLRAKILSFGACLQDLRLEGQSHPLVLGHADPQAYLSNPAYFGAIVGRYANRIAQGRARIGERVVQLDQNTPQGHLLHGGRAGTGHLNWRVLDHTPEHAALAITLPDGHMGFPGQLEVRATYRLLPDATLEIAISATTSAPTLCSFASHNYFNLDGAPDLTGHTLRVGAETYLPIDATGIPLGHTAPVAGTRFDLREPRGLGTDLAFDHCFCFDGAQVIRPVATLTAGPVAMALHSDAPGLQVYTGDGIAPDGRFGPRAGVALEPQIWPDAPNHPSFPQAELHPGETFQQRTQFRFCAN